MFRQEVISPEYCAMWLFAVFHIFLFFVLRSPAAVPKLMEEL
jgi:hypothetical protein